MGGFSSSESGNKSAAYSGLRGTEYENQAADQTYRAGLRLNDVTNSFGVNPLGQTTYQGFTGQQLLPGGRFGLGANADLAMQTMGSQLFGRASSDMAGRGMLSPENQSAVVGSAITQALPQVLPQIQSWQQAQFMAPMQLGQYATQNAQTAADYWNRVMGAKSSSEGGGSGFGMNIFGFGATSDSQGED